MIHFLLATHLALLAVAERPKDLPAQAEVRASSGPVQLTLRIYETRISSKEGFWYQLELKNIGKEEFLVIDEVFWDSLRMAYAIRSHSIGTRLEILDPDGKAIEPTTFQYEYHSLDEPWPPPAFVEESSEVNGLRDQWRKEGLSEREIRDRLIKRQARLNDDRSRDARPKTMLQPGQTIATPPWVDRGFSLYKLAPYDEHKPAKGQFAEASYFIWKKKGVYRIRAVYDHEARSEVGRQYSHRRRVVTPWIRLRVDP